MTQTDDDTFEHALRAATDRVGELRNELIDIPFWRVFKRRRWKHAILVTNEALWYIAAAKRYNLLNNKEDEQSSQTTSK